jgi:hypothetical protein
MANGVNRKTQKSHAFAETSARQWKSKGGTTREGPFEYQLFIDVRRDFLFTLFLNMELEHRLSKTKGKITVSLDDQGNVSWSRGGSGMTVREFVEKFPCKALKQIEGGDVSGLADAIISTIGGAGKLIEFNHKHLCGADDGVLQQV